MKPIKSLKGKRVALLGLGISQIDYVIGKENGKEWDEDSSDEGSDSAGDDDYDPDADFGF